MNRLVIVSNRVALPGKGATGGLAVALRSALKAQTGIWCGSSGNIREYPRTMRKTESDIQYIVRDLTQAEHDDYYVGFANSMLWPLFHYHMSCTHYTEAMYAQYAAVNDGFAQLVADQLQADDIIWAHDYHFLLLAQALRKRNVAQRIGFFLHIPFPAPEMLMTLPVYRELLRAMCHYDLLGFQTQRDLDAFLRCIRELCGGREVASSNGLVEIHAFGRRLQAGCFPISIDTHAMVRTAEQARIGKKITSLKESLNGRRMIIGVDRLDYTKGLLARLKAYHHFLQTYPDQQNHVSYIQITPPTRTDVEDYRSLREQLETLAAHTNGVNADVDWVPIRYLNKSFSQKELAGFYRLADVGLVTPLRDGMNLVAKEYVASQDPEDPGVLVLSQFAGAAQELEAALIVNPFDPEAMGHAIQRALSMPLAERKERHGAMMEVLARNDIDSWMRDFMNALRPASVSPIAFSRPYVTRPEVMAESSASVM